MGGHVTAAAIEQYRNEYDGAMPICGVLGDHELFDFFLDYNLVAAALRASPPSRQTSPMDDRVRAARSEHVGGGVAVGLTPAGENLKSLTELGRVESGRSSTAPGSGQLPPAVRSARRHRAPLAGRRRRQHRRRLPVRLRSALSPPSRS
jgi:hypothetical protein